MEYGSHPGGIVATVFQPTQTINDVFRHVLFTDDTDNTAHKNLLNRVYLYTKTVKKQLQIVTNQNSMTHCVLNSKLLPLAEAHISVADRGFRFGDGVFETIAVYGGVPYQWELHQKRLESGLEAIKIRAETQNLRKLSLELIAKNNVKNGVLRIAISRGVGSLGYFPDKPKATVVIEAENRTFKAPDVIALGLSSYEKPSPACLPVEYKLAQGLNSTLARMEAVEKNCFDALLLNGQKHITETSSANIFWIKDSMLYTPAPECGVLLGTTRAAMIRLSPYPVRQGSFPLQEMLDAEEVFLTNAHWQILPVHRFENKTWTHHAYTEALQIIYRKDIESYVAAHRV
ncbi:MAG: hypothetical protein EB060_08210 [Proteobacteria bacterium]|nr:hypothetical protein [Pseudomonadota bacterium]